MIDPLNYEILSNKPNGLRLTTGSGERSDYGVIYRVTKCVGTVETKVATLNMDEITNAVLLDILVHRILITKSDRERMLAKGFQVTSEADAFKDDSLLRMLMRY